ncbi:MAG: AAA family ATPase [Bradymonadaceae bacterium]|nr:AAA family ATPase [Lujinxingiaceae bacterium]
MEDTLETARQLLEKIESTEDEDRYRDYRDQLYGLGPEIIPLLREDLSHRHPSRRMAAATNLGRLGHLEAVPGLIMLVNDPQASVREMAIFALGILGDLAAVDAVLGALHDYDADVRYRALVALGDLNYAQLEDVLVRCMGDEAFGVREQGLSQLRKVASPKAVAVVLKSLLEREVEMQQMAEEILDRIVPKMTREHYKRLPEQLTPRERRLILNYFEARNLQEVYGTLWQRLQLVSRAAAAPRGLDKYGRLLNNADEQPFLMHAYGRDDVVSQLVDHFTDPKASRSILLVGQAGVGKTAIIHEMTQRLVELGEELDWQIMETNTSELISGTRYLGDWETKLKEMAEAILKHDRVIVYLTNPNDLLGAGAHSKSDENFADFFKPYLQRGQIRIIAECTEDDLKKGLTRDPGFLRLFRQVKVHEMDDAQTLDVLKKRLVDYRVRTDYTITAESGCLESVVDFSRSFFTRSVGPGRACDLLDALVDQTTRNLEAGASVLLQAENIPPCLAEITGISLDLLDDTIPLSLSETRKWFLDRLVDQEHAVDTIVNRLALIKSGLGDADKPLGVFFLVGPTGVGKTYFTKLVAERLFGTADRMLRFDLSEYQGRFAIEKLIGSPHDKDREGLLTEAVRNQPYSVLLFDEFEKADSEIFNLFLQILDEGRLTDARGNTTDFRQTLIFLTSNLGASRASLAPVGFGEGANEISGRIRHKLDEFFAPEFLNRLDDIVVFSPLTEAAMARLVDIELAKAFKRRGFKRRNLEVDVKKSARKWLEEHGFSPRFGARELKRTIEKSVLTEIGRQLISESGPHENKLIKVSLTEGRIAVNIEESTSKKAAVPREPRAPTRIETT